MDSERIKTPEDPPEGVTAQRVPFPSSLWSWLRSMWSELGPAGLTPAIVVRIQVTDPASSHPDLPLILVELLSPVVPGQGEWIRVEGVDVWVESRSWSVVGGKLAVLLRTSTGDA